VTKILGTPPPGFPSATPVATPLARNMAAAKDPLNPNRLRVTPLAQREHTLGERRYINSK
jgi:hypothetical protein